MVTFRSLIITDSSTYMVFSVPALELVLQHPERRCVAEPPQSFRHVRPTAACVSRLPVDNDRRWTMTAGVSPSERAPVELPVGQLLAVSPPATPLPGSAFVVVTEATMGEGPTPGSRSFYWIGE